MLVGSVDGDKGLLEGLATSPATTCSACGSDNVRPSTTFRSSDWPIAYCLDCGSQYTTRLVEPYITERLYDWDRYGREIYEGGRAQERARRSFFRALLGQLSPPVAEGETLLDVGSGPGHLIAVANELGLRATGIEPDQRTRIKAAGRIGTSALLGESAEFGGGLGPYDLVVFSHVLEHMPDPFRAMKQAVGVLAPGGRVIVRVPNVESPAARCLGVNWRWFCPPIHLHYFSRVGLRKLFGRSGLVIERELEARGDGHLFPAELALGLAKAALGHRVKGRVWSDGPVLGTSGLERVARSRINGWIYDWESWIQPKISERVWDCSELIFYGRMVPSSENAAMQERRLRKP